jgi:hypothetical protein
MAKLIEKHSTKYARRMVAEIRKAFAHGVYYVGARVSAAKFSDGGVAIKTTMREQWWPVADLDGFQDGYGRNIVASRES